VRIAGLPAQGAKSARPAAAAPAAASGEFAHIDLGQNERARLPQLFDDECVGGRNGPFEQLRTCGGGQIEGVIIVFEDYRDSVEWAARPFGFALGVKGPGRLQRLGIKDDHRIDHGPLLIVGRDSSQIRLGQRFRGEGAIRHGGLDVDNGGGA